MSVGLTLGMMGAGLAAKAGAGLIPYQYKRHEIAKPFDFGINPRETGMRSGLVSGFGTDVEVFNEQITPFAKSLLEGIGGYLMGPADGLGDQLMNQIIGIGTYGQGSPMTQFNGIPLAKSGIHIKPSKKGTFTAWCKRHGYGGVTAACIAAAKKKGGSVAKKAVFAQNAKKWDKG